jgi:photosystem II stability/assembly factor-like uncharacterized protein
MYTPNISMTGSALVNNAFSTAQSSTTWEIVHHGFESDDTTMSDIAFFNATHGWAVGQSEVGLGNGIILHTTDGGMTWSLQLANASQEFRSIEIVNESCIIISCFYGVIRSYDAGKTWDYSALISQRSLFGDVAFFNSSYGWVGGNWNIYFTTDGGMNWTTLDSWTFDDIPRGIQIVSVSEVRIIAFEGMYRTIDGGATWNQQNQYSGWDIVSDGDSGSWAVSDGMLLCSADGETWEVKPNPRPVRHDPSRPPYFTDITFIDKDHGWLVGKETPVAYTPDGGRSWYSQTVPEEMDTRVLAVDFYNETLGWATCWGGYIMRTGQGNTTGVLLSTAEPISVLPILGLGGIAVVVVSLVLLLLKRRKSPIDMISSSPVGQRDDHVQNRKGGPAVPGGVSPS